MPKEREFSVGYDFINWISECFRDGLLTEEEIIHVLEESYKALEVWQEIATMDWRWWAEKSQKNIKYFKENCLKK